MKTIKQLADELGVSKTTIRNYMNDDFRAKHTAKDRKGVITISDEGCKLIAETTANQRKESETTANQFAETELCTVPRSVLTALEEQLRQKDEQLAAKDKQISDLTETIKAQAQSINAARHNELAGTLTQQIEMKPKKKWFFW